MRGITAGLCAATLIAAVTFPVAADRPAPRADGSSRDCVSEPNIWQPQTLEIVERSARGADRDGPRASDSKAPLSDCVLV